MIINLSYEEQALIDYLEGKVKELLDMNLSRDDFHSQIVKRMKSRDCFSDRVLNIFMKCYDDKAKYMVRMQIARIASAKNHKGKISARKWQVAQWRRKF